ncbi:MAG TPA: DUF1800 domain-containing protein [Cytophagaceae bacterium]|jgi:uncharacterized protein (DUF1800 family)|nr:DUF1800 domain-containing protein [Cytophagaceae bacterium]
MKAESIYSLRIGFSNKHSGLISSKGIKSYILYLFDNPLLVQKPEFILSSEEAERAGKEFGGLSENEKELKRQEDREKFHKLQNWWLQKMYTSENPLQERMTLFWHNHFVSSYQKVKISSYMFYQNNLFREYAFGNIKKLTTEILYNNAMLIYLDNKQNKVGRPNENLSRELLELFTLGIGNYTETDISEGARALAGLAPGRNEADYIPANKDNGDKIYLNKKGNLNATDLVDAIFSHPRAPYRITEKLLKYFLTDEPDSNLINEYAQFLKKSDYELKPFLLKLFTDKNFLSYNGQKIKDPLTFILQTFNELNICDIPFNPTMNFLKNQNMELLNPPNVKGWDGGRTWLDSGKLVARAAVINNIFNKTFGNKLNMDETQMIKPGMGAACLAPKLNLETRNGSSKNIIQELSDRMLFEVDSNLEEDMENVLKYDFDLSAPNANESILKLGKIIMKTPQYQIL